MPIIHLYIKHTPARVPTANRPVPTTQQLIHLRPETHQSLSKESKRKRKNGIKGKDMLVGIGQRGLPHMDGVRVIHKRRRKFSID